MKKFDSKGKNRVELRKSYEINRKWWVTLGMGIHRKNARKEGGINLWSDIFEDTEMYKIWGLC